MEDINLEPDSIVDDNDTIHIGDIEFRVIHTPGHTSGSSSLYCEQESCYFLVIHCFMEHGEERTYQQVALMILLIQ